MSYRQSVTALFITAILLTTAVHAEQSLKAQNIENVTPDYINTVTVSDIEGGVQIRGNTSDSANLSRYMRFLQDSVGSPNLVSLRKEGASSYFVLEIKDFN